MKRIIILAFALLWGFYSISQSITVTQPNGGETLYGCQAYTIKWASSGVSNFYNIDYSLNGGTTWTSVASNLNITNGQYDWTVPMSASSQVYVRIRDKNDTTKQDRSNAYFNIQLPITVNSPNGGEAWQGLSSHSITWTPAGTSGFFNLYYSVNNGSSWTSIVSNIAANNYTWSVPNNPSTTSLVKVQDATTSCQLDISDAVFEITPAIPILTAPNGGEVWTINSNRNITWNTSTFHTSVLLEFSTDNGVQWNQIIASTPNTGSYTWTIPNTPSTQVLVRAKNASGSTVFDISNAPFTIQMPNDYITYPNGGEVLRSGNTHNITWDNTVFSSSVKIEYSINNGSTWSTITSSVSNSGSYAWTVPQMVTTTQALIRITNNTVPTIVDVSNAVFTIMAPITVDDPNTSAILTTCSTISINWSRTTAFNNYNNSDGSSSYRNTYELYYSVNGGTYNYITSVMNSQSQYSYTYNWTVPDIAPGSIKIKIIGYWNTYQYGSPAPIYWIDSSDVAAPTANPGGTITVTNPNGGVSLNALTPYNVTWTASGTSGYFDVLYSVNGGTSYSTLISNITGNSYNWNVNNNPSTNVFVRVRDNQNICRKDASNSANTIVAATPILTSPNGGEIWKVNSTQNITWNTTTLFTSAFIEYSIDNGVSWNIVVVSTPNTGSYTWTIPNTVTTQALIRISNVGYPSNSDVSNAPFTINLPTPLLTSPNGGETWRSMNTHNITWDASTVASNVKIEYTTNNGSTWSTISASTSNTGTYAWTIPQMLTTTQALVRITNTSFTSAVDTSNSVFTIFAPVTVDDPNTSLTLTTCSIISINWSRTTAFNNYNNSDGSSSYRNTYELYYSVNGGTYNYITSVMNSQSQYSYSYNWTVPDIAPGTIKIKIISLYNTYQYGSPAPTFWVDSSDVAANTANPSGTITVTNPNGGVTLNALTPYNVTWTASGTSGYFDVLYSVNGGTSYSTLTSNISGYTYIWNVNNNPSTNVFIRVRDNQNTCRKDASNSSNTIVAATPILTSPNGGEVWKVNSSQNITWNTTTLFTSAFIEYSIDNGVSWNIVVVSTPNTGSYTWTIPNTVTTQALIRISNVGYPSNSDVSNAPFTINLPTPLLTSPNGGETWRSMNTHNITWDASTVASNVKIEYTANNGSTWSTISASTSNTGTYAWTIPQMLTTTQALVRITNTSFTSAVDTSNSVFTIFAPVTVDDPNTSLTLTTCSIISINWSRTTAFNNYNNSDGSSSYRNTYELYYSVNGGTYNYITSVMNSQSQYSYSYNWTVPDIAPGTIKIKIISLYNTYQYGSPAPTFWVDSSDVAANTANPSGTITVTNPNGGVTLNALTPYNVTWTASGTSGYFDVLYSVNGGTSYSTLTSNISGYTYIWNVNNNPSTNVFIRVRDNQNTCRKDASNSSNTIVAATPILTSPNGGEVWKVNSSQNITWNTTTLFTSAFIEYSIDNGVSWNIVVVSTPNTGSYTWTIPNTVTTQALIRISNVGYPSNSDVSNAPFTINLPTPLLTSPNGGETWRSMNTHNITWDASTVASNVKIEYTANNGSTWSTISASTSNTGTYAWTIPQMLTTTQALVRITNTSFTSAVDTSNSVFTIFAPVTVDDPNTSLTLTTCSIISINWSRTTAFNNYNNSDGSSSYRNTYELYYSVNGGTYNYITSVMNSQSQYSYSYNWTVPDIAPGTIKIKIISLYNTYQYGSPAPTFWVDSSDVAANTANPSGTITVINPNGGVTLNALTPYNVTWTASGTSGYFDVQYSINGGSSYSTLTSNISSNNYTWNVNNVPGTNVFVRVRDNQNTCRKDASNSANTIVAAAPILTSPNGGEMWNVNTSQNITWNTTTLFTNVFIEYSIDNGVSWNIVVASTANTGSYSWTIPNTVTTQAKIRISNVGYPSNFDVSNAAFTISLPKPLITSPNGGETWRSLNTQNITWDVSTVTSNLKLEYSVNNGSSWNTITSSTTNTGTYAWSVPQMHTTTQALVRITSSLFPNASDTSNAVFNILAPVTVDDPNTSLTLTTCSTYSINWSRTTSFNNYNNSDGSSSYRNTYELYYSVNGGTYNYITSVMNSQSQYSYSYNWTVPDIAPGTIKIKIISIYNTYQYGSPAPTFWIDSSDVAANTANPSGTITVTSPNGGVTLNALTPYNVTWTANGTSGYFDVLYSVNGGTSYSTLTSNVGGASYTWNVNNNPSTNVFVRVRDNQNTCRKDASNSANTILAATPILTSPNGGEVWNVSSTNNITWNAASLYSPVFIEYSTDNGVTWNIVVNSTANTGSYSWNVPFTPSTQAKIRISNTSNPLLYDESNSAFTIQIPTPVVTAPNGGETWYAGETRSITWQTSSFFSSTVNIEYSLDGGGTYNTIANNQTNNGTYSWTLPSVNSANALIKVSNSSNTAYYDVSNALLTLRPYVRLITPNGGEQLGSCTQTTISFERAPTYTSFNIEYSIDGGLNWVVIQSNQTYSSTFNNYSWTIPNNPSAQALVRVYPYGVVSRADQSDALFTIKRAVTIVQPNYGGVLVVGASYPVKWLSDGISNIYDIAYSASGPTGPWTNIVLGYNTSINTYNWTVPNTPSTNCYLRIRDNISSCKEDISDLAFTIASTPNPITLTAPNGGDSLHACQSYNITWTETGTPAGSYNISYSIDYGVNWIPVVTSYPTLSGVYQWTVPNMNISGALIRVQSAINPLVFDYSNALFIIVPGRLNTNNDVTICAGSSVQLNTTGGSNYTWTPTTGLSNPNIPNPLATPTTTTQYIVRSTSNGCSLSDTVMITINPSSGLVSSVSITSSTNNPICSGTTVTFTATPANGGMLPAYQWKINGINTGANTYSFSTAGLTPTDVVSCIMTSSLQCVTNNPATSNAINLTVNLPPAAPIVTSNSPVPVFGTILLNASTISGATYNWSGPGGFTSILQNPTIPNANTGMSGIYSVYATLNACSGTAGTTTVSVSGTPANVNISGIIRTEQGSLVRGVTVKCTGQSRVDSLVTTTNGQYSFSLIPGGSYSIAPTKNNDIDIRNGISTIDLVMLQRHIIGTAFLNSGYKIIAGDVNVSSGISNMDIILIKSLILGNTFSFPGTNFWKFVNSDYHFSNPQNPFPYESSRAYSSASAQTDQDFIAIKLGDVNNSWNPAIAKSYSTQQVVFSIPVKEANLNDTVVIPLIVNGFENLTGYQYSLKWDPGKLSFIEATNGMLYNSFGTSRTRDGILSGLWCTENLNGVSVSDATEIAYFKFKVNEVSSIINEIRFTSDPTAVESYDPGLNQLDMITVNGGVKRLNPNNIDENGSTVILSQNQPNPFSDATYIPFYSSAGSKISIVIYNILGDEINRFDNSYDIGNHLIRWDGTDKNGVKQPDGNYLIRLQTGKTTQIIKTTLIH